MFLLNRKKENNFARRAAPARREEPKGHGQPAHKKKAAKNP
jgi:hypothetical protein